MTKGRVKKKVENSTLASETHPPNVEKNKKTCCFWVFFSSFGTAIFFNLQPTMHFQLPPLITTTNYLCTPLPPPSMVSGAVVDAGGRWHQWWVVAVGDRCGGSVGGNSGVGLQ